VTTLGCGAITVNFAEACAPPPDARILATVELPTGVVVTRKVAEEAAFGTTTDPGTTAQDALLDKTTLSPLVPAGLVKLTVAVAVDPPVTVAGATLTDLTACAEQNAGATSASSKHPRRIARTPTPPPLI
jgi:hypothetical protein